MPDRSVIEAMNFQHCHGEERSDVAIHLESSWIAAVGKPPSQ
jgi:hypothetical protein